MKLQLYMHEILSMFEFTCIHWDVLNCVGFQNIKFPHLQEPIQKFHFLI